MTMMSLSEQKSATKKKHLKDSHTWLNRETIRLLKLILKVVICGNFWKGDSKKWNEKWLKSCEKLETVESQRLWQKIAKNTKRVVFVFFCSCKKIYKAQVKKNYKYIKVKIHRFDRQKRLK